MPDALEAGAIIAERYRLERLLGEGGMGSVWAATHQLTRHGVALKFLKPEAIKNAAAVRRFMREARAATAVNHPNVIQVHDIFTLGDGMPVMVMDLLNGETLARKLMREGRIALPELAKLMVPVLSAVGSAHASGIVHRDLKPENIFLSLAPDGSVVPKVLDFGIAKLDAKSPDAQQSAELTRTGAQLGTPYYMSPEQVFGEKDVDARSDVWAVGVILYEALTGQRPVDGDNLGQLFKVIALGAIRPIDELAPDLPAEVRDLINRMLITDRSRRAQDLREAFEVLRRFTSEMAQSFSEVRVQIPGDTTNPGLARASDALTPDAGPRLQVTSGAFSHTGPGNTIVIPTRKTSPWLVVGAVAGVIAVGAIVVAVRSPSSVNAVAPATAAASDNAATPSSIEVVPVAQAAPAVTSADTTTRTDAAAPVPAATRRVAGPAAHVEKSPTAPQSAAPPPPPATTTSLGGVATSAPF